MIYRLKYVKSQISWKALMKKAYEGLLSLLDEGAQTRIRKFRLQADKIR